MKRVLKILLVMVAVIGGLYLAISHFMSLGTSQDAIEQYNYHQDFTEGVDSLSQNWSKKDFNQLKELYADLAIVGSMGAVEEESLSEYKNSLDLKADLILRSYFNQKTWNESELQSLNKFAKYIEHNYTINAVSGYYSIQSLFASSQVCRTQSQVENCIAESAKYSVQPWSNCTSLKDGLASVPNTSMTSYTNKTLLPKCRKMNNFKSNYSYFDDFDADYQMLKNAQIFLGQHKYSNSTLDASFKSIKYNDAANALDPKFF